MNPIQNIPQPQQSALKPPSVDAHKKSETPQEYARPTPTPPPSENTIARGRGRMARMMDKMSFPAPSKSGIANLFRSAAGLVMPNNSIESENAIRVTALHNAARAGNVAQAIGLLNDEMRPVDVNAPNKNGFTAVHLAAQLGDPAFFSMLMQQPNVNLNAQGKDGRTPLHLAAHQGHTEVIKLLLNEIDPLPDRDGQTALHTAAYNNRPGAIELLLDKIDVNASCEKGLTPLHIAARQGSLAAAEILLAKAADIDARSRAGATAHANATALQIATQRRRLDVVKLLVANKADLKAKGPDGATPLHDAALQGDPAVIEFLLKNKVDLSADDHGVNPLHYAAAAGHKEAEALLRTKYGATVQCDEGLTPKDYEAGCADVRKLMEEAKKKRPDMTDPQAG